MSNKSWIEKLKIKVEEDGPNGGCNIIIEWDETDSALELWNFWGEEGQKAFIIDALYNAVECYVD
jgi:hypothetical protein